MTETQKYIELRSGTRMPLLGYGTYQIPNDDTGVEALLFAIDNGYKLIDCASLYKNEEVVGKAISMRDRSSLFVVSKVWNDAIFKGAAAVRASCMQSIRDLNCGYLDLYLIHFPVSKYHVAAYKELQSLKKEGFVKEIGVSNYTIEDIQELEAAGVKDLPAVNQMEINPFLFRQATIAYCRSKGIAPMAFRGLGMAKHLEDSTIRAAADSLGVSSAQLLGRWLTQQGICHIAKSVRKHRILNNGDIFGFEIPKTLNDKLNHLTTPEALEAHREWYVTRLNRDTTLPNDFTRKITIE